MLGPTNNLQTILNQAVQHQRSGRFAEAIPLYQQALRLAPGNHQILSALGVCHTCIDQAVEGRKHLEQAIQLAPREARYHHQLAYTYKREGKFAQAHACFDKAIALDPKDPSFVASKAELYHMAGDYAKAMATLEPALAKHAEHANVTGVFAVVARQVKREREAIALVERLLARQDIMPATRIKNSFELGALYDAVGEHDKAFESYARGHRLKGDKWSAAEHTKLVDQVIAAWNRPAVAALPKSTVDGSRHVFIVGMPRSGTSLVEQIASTAPTVHGAGELNDLLRVARDVQGSVAMGIPMVWSLERLRNQANLENYGRSYASAIARLAGPGFTIVTDKQPVNFLNLGLVQAILPGAKVIHCRREPMDSCLSCYFQLFAGFMGFANELADCGRFYADYERIMAHWHATLDLPILDLPYEEMVADQEGTTRRLMEFLGLPFRDESLRFHEINRPTLTASSQQVRQPIYRRSVARWKRYERHLGPLRTALGRYAPADEASPPAV